MDMNSAFTIGDILGAANAIVAISAAIGALVAGAAFLLKPFKKLEERVSKLENERSESEASRTDLRKEVDTLKEGNKVMQLAMLALLDHGIDGNNVEQMKQAKELLQMHLVEK